jgi:hypothetical protein
MALNQVGLERLNTATTDKIGTNKNIIINGAMQVAQRGTSSTSTGYQTVDRFAISYNGTDEAPTQAQVSVTSGTTPFESGLSKAFKITNGDQSSGAGAADHIHTSYSIEDQDLAASGWNYKSSSSYVTLSFYVKSSIAQNFYFYLQSDNGSQFRYVMETGSLSADTWTKITKTIPGNSNIVLNSDNGVGMYIVYSLFDGTDRTGTRPLNAWAALDNTSRTPDQTATWYTTNNSTWEITGVQLEVGSVATDFEHRSFGQELALCQRYYETHNSLTTAKTTDGAVTSQWSTITSNDGNTLVVSTGIIYKVPKRASPTVTIYNPSDTSTAARVNAQGTERTVTASYGGPNALTRIYVSGASAGNYVAYNWEASAEL